MHQTLNFQFILLFIFIRRVVGYVRKSFLSPAKLQFLVNCYQTRCRRASLLKEAIVYHKLLLLRYVNICYELLCFKIFRQMNKNASFTNNSKNFIIYLPHLLNSFTQKNKTRFVNIFFVLIKSSSLDTSGNFYPTFSILQHKYTKTFFQGKFVENSE